MTDTMDWCARYNNLHSKLIQTPSSGLIFLYSRIDVWSDDLVVIACILLTVTSQNRSTVSTFDTTDAYKFLQICKTHGTDVGLVNCLESLLRDLSITDNTFEFVDSAKKSPIKQINDFEFQIILFFIKYKFPASLNKPPTEQTIGKIQSKMQEILKSTATTDSLSPYLTFLQTIKYGILILQLKDLQSKSRWSSYLSTSFQILNEGLFDLSSSNEPFLEWYLSTSDISQIIPVFTNSLLLEPYGYFKHSIIEKIRLYFLNIGKLNRINSIHLNANDQSTKLLKSLAFERFFKLSANDPLLTHIRSNSNDSQFQIIFKNLIETNIVFASRKFSSVKISTLLSLFGLDTATYSSSQMLDVILRLSESKKIVVKIDQCDETVVFPLLNVNDSKSLDHMFSRILPLALERDWSRLI